MIRVKWKKELFKKLNNARTKEGKQLRKWIKALRSGKYSQTQHILQDNNGYCCLGVACKALIPEEKLKFDCYLDGRSFSLSYLDGGHPSDQPHAPDWLKKISELVRSFNFKNEIGQGLGLIEMNDIEYASFDEIADMLELIFVKNVFNVK